jgi:hypothetical protein
MENHWLAGLASFTLQSHSQPECRMDKVTELSEIGRQLNELGKQQKQAQQNGNWTEDNRLQAKIAELMKRREDILNKN